jgi:hypothetical protein
LTGMYPLGGIYPAGISQALVQPDGLWPLTLIRIRVWFPRICSILKMIAEIPVVFETYIIIYPKLGRPPYLRRRLKPADTSKVLALDYVVIRQNVTSIDESWAAFTRDPKMGHKNCGWPQFRFDG